MVGRRARGSLQDFRFRFPREKIASTWNWFWREKPRLKFFGANGGGFVIGHWGRCDDENKLFYLMVSKSISTLVALFLCGNYHELWAEFSDWFDG